MYVEFTNSSKLNLQTRITLKLTKEKSSGFFASVVDGKPRGQAAFSSYITRCCGSLICSWSWKLLLSFSVRSKLYWGIGFLHTITKLTNHYKKKVPVCVIPEEKEMFFEAVVFYSHMQKCTNQLQLTQIPYTSLLDSFF